MQDSPLPKQLNARFRARLDGSRFVLRKKSVNEGNAVRDFGQRILDNRNQLVEFRTCTVSDRLPRLIELPQANLRRPPIDLSPPAPLFQK